MTHQLDGTTVPGSLSVEDEAYLQSVLSDDEGASPKRAPDSGPAPVQLPTLPATIWGERPALQHIHTAAAARMVSPDVVLLCVLVRLASMLDHRLRLDIGRGPAQLCEYLAVVGPSGVGKTSGVRAARDVLPAPEKLTEPNGYGIVPFQDGLPIGSGEGLAAVYWGAVLDDDGKLIYRQVRYRALIVVDEGQRLTALGERRGSTTGETLRSAWAGETIGSHGAAETTRRIIPAGAYTLGLIAGYQLGTAQALVSDVDTGTAQRFLWVAATHPGVTDRDVPDWPGPLPSPWERRDGDHPGIPDGWQDGTCTIGYPDHVVTAIRAEHAARQRGEITPAPGDEHAPLHRARLAALLALLDQRRNVTDDDWRLGETIWTTSRAVRDAVVEHGRQTAARERAERDEARVTLAERTAAVVEVAPERVQRLAGRIAGYVHTDGGLTRSEARRRLRSGERHLFDAAATVAELRGWVVIGHAGLAPGEAKP